MKKGAGVLINVLPMALLAYFLISAILLTGYLYEHHEPFVFTFQYLGPAIFLIMLTIYRQFFVSNGVIRRLIMVTQFLFLWAIITLMSTGYVLWINSTIGDSEEFCFQGSVIDKRVKEESLLVKEHIVELNDINLHRVVLLNVSKKQYQQIGIGDDFKNCMQEGWLGLKYSKR